MHLSHFAAQHTGAVIDAVAAHQDGPGFVSRRLHVPPVCVGSFWKDKLGDLVPLKRS